MKDEIWIIASNVKSVVDRRSCRVKGVYLTFKVSDKSEVKAHVMADSNAIAG